MIYQIKTGKEIAITIDNADSINQHRRDTSGKYIIPVEPYSEKSDLENERFWLCSDLTPRLTDIICLIKSDSNAIDKLNELIDACEGK